MKRSLRKILQEANNYYLDNSALPRHSFLYIFRLFHETGNEIIVVGEIEKASGILKFYKEIGIPFKVGIASANRYYARIEKSYNF